jgi:predicted Zn-dependent protease
METGKTKKGETVKIYPVFSLFILVCGLWWIPSQDTAHAMMSIEEERNLREELLQMVKSQVSLVGDPEIVGYVSDMGQKALRQVEAKFFDYQFYVIKDEGINAFAMPGGLVFVHSGLLEVIDTEDELFCVLAHEIGHVQGRHIARRMDRMTKVNIATAAMAVAGLFLGSGEASSALLATSGALNASIALKYSREDEEEADRRAYQWICEAGYDPRGLISILKKMQRYRWLGTDAIPSYLSTHPASSQRMVYLEDLWQEEPCTRTSLTDHYRLQRIQVKVRLMTQDPLVLVKRYRREVDATPGDMFLQYGLAQSLLAARDYDEAIKAFNTLVAQTPDKPEFLVDLGEAYFAAGRYKEAIGVLETFERDHPGDRAADYYLAMAFLESGSPDKALPLLKSLERGWPDQAAIFLQTGRCLAALQRTGEAHYYFFLHYRDTGSIETADYHRTKAMALLPRDGKIYEELKRGNDEWEKDARKRNAHGNRNRLGETRVR